MILLTHALVLLLGHFVADFVLQTNAMAVGKSRSHRILATHIAEYGAVMVLFAAPVLALNWAALGWFMLWNCGSHYVIDAITSRQSKRLFAVNRIHDAFAVIGFDQLLHTTILFVTLALLQPGAYGR